MANLRDAKMVNDKRENGPIRGRRRVLTGSLHTVPDIHRLFNLHNDEIVWEFYASYAATLRGSISKRSKPLPQDPLTSTLVRGCSVDISPSTIRRFLYGPTADHSWSLNTSEFDYRWDIVLESLPSEELRRRERDTLVGQIHCCEMAASREWVVAHAFGHPEGDINFVAKFLQFLVRSGVDQSDNQRSTLPASLLARYERHWGPPLLTPFHALFFGCAGTLECDRHCDRLVHPTGALDIGLIRDEANVAAPRREPQVKVPHLGTDLAFLMGRAGAMTPRPSHHPGSFSRAASMGP
ncbi:hypothetical protein H5410_015041 [Solanum commersonii]|uniref:Uncharacterized protein n=1 Tax=Solanum commersonii TaxID=4109 RepID=A0A9J5ZSN2_SOLCO|nr:hypothetical protein H5410_015041 [Solanum commersonii]